MGINGGSGAGKVDPSDFSLVTFVDKSTPKFVKSICKGTHIATGTLSAVKAGTAGKPFFTIDFEELFVTSIQMTAANEIPAVNLSFSYDKIAIDYSIQNAKGDVASTGAVRYSRSENKVS